MISRSKLSLNRTLILVFISFSLSAQSKQSARFGLKDSVIEPQRVRDKSADESVWICANGGHSSRPTNDEKPAQTSPRPSRHRDKLMSLWDIIKHRPLGTKQVINRKSSISVTATGAAVKTGNFPDATSQRCYFCISEKLL